MIEITLNVFDLHDNNNFLFYFKCCAILVNDHFSIHHSISQDSMNHSILNIWNNNKIMALISNFCHTLFSVVSFLIIG